MDLLLINLPSEIIMKVEDYIKDEKKIKLFFLNKKFYKSNYDNIFKVIENRIRLDSYIRKMLRNDLSYFLLLYIKKIDFENLMKKKITYKKIKMNYAEYLKKLINIYGCNKCRKVFNM